MKGTGEADPDAGLASRFLFDCQSTPLPFFPEVTWQSVNELMHFSGGEYDVLARQMDSYLNLFPPAAMVFCEPDGGFQRRELHGRCVGGPELHAAVRRTVI
ncbi:hypothetical protein DLJ82_0268 [Rhizobium leguminosarum]|uniref:Uncharacterized protein n=1 Tax=Rhizobium leguminosarum TaxID=384 RepID=A0A2Z4YAV5_RHILE|nr:hypothetical protein DLJ82_0268 [Rhizobium leguminosarum]